MSDSRKSAISARSSWAIAITSTPPLLPGERVEITQNGSKPAMLFVMTARLTKKEREVEAVMAASRALVAITARSFSEADIGITLQQWRVLVLVGTSGPVYPGALAEWMGVHPSNATRACDALVRAKLLDRREDPGDRRRMALTLTRKGEKLVATLLEHRRQAIASILDEMPAAHRSALAKAMQAFADAAGDNPEHFVGGAGHTF